MYFGLTIEKVALLAVVAGVIIGPDRLPSYARTLAELVKSVRGFVKTTSSRFREEMGDDFDHVDWQKLDPRQYDPRRIIRSALLEDPTPPPTPTPAKTNTGSRTTGAKPAPRTSDPDAVNRPESGS